MHTSHFTLQVCQWPAAFSADLPIKVARTLPFAAIVHLLIAFWAWSLIGTPLSGALTPSWVNSASSQEELQATGNAYFSNLLAIAKSMCKVSSYSGSRC